MGYSTDPAAAAAVVVVAGVATPQAPDNKNDVLDPPPPYSGPLPRMQFTYICCQCQHPTTLPQPTLDSTDYDSDDLTCANPDCSHPICSIDTPPGTGCVFYVEVSHLVCGSCSYDMMPLAGFRLRDGRLHVVSRSWKDCNRCHALKDGAKCWGVKWVSQSERYRQWFHESMDHDDTWRRLGLKKVEGLTLDGFVRLMWKVMAAAYWEWSFDDDDIF